MVVWLPFLMSVRGEGVNGSLGLRGLGFGAEGGRRRWAGGGGLPPGTFGRKVLRGMGMRPDL